jgi:hypothetical protein
LLAHGRWFSPGTPASSTTKTGRYDIAEILLKVALDTTNQSIDLSLPYLFHYASPLHDQPCSDEMYSIQDYAIKFVNYLPQGVEFSVYSGIPPPMKLAATIQLK